MNEFLQEIYSSPFFAICLSVLAYAVGYWLNRKTGLPLLNPLLIAIILVVLVIQVLHIPMESYNQGGDIISMFLAPATAVLAVSIYRQLDILKKNIVPVVAGAVVGSLVSMGSVTLLCRLFRLEEKITASLLPKSVTTPIAMGISEQHGGIVSVTVAAVVVTGIVGAMLAPALIKLFRVKNPVAAGVAIGTASHALGTSKAIEIGEIEGAMSGIAIGAAGLCTVIFAMFAG